MCQATMPLETEKDFSAANLKTIRGRTHSRCVVCASGNPLGLNLEFTLTGDGAVEGSFTASSVLQGYDGLVHGGVIASMLDGAMTNCLFAHGKEALTAELVVRYRKPVLVGERIALRAWIEKSSSLLFCMRAELSQNGCVKAAASAKFLNRP
jgi:uncharacterized protein (TIGR00369 family)